MVAQGPGTRTVTQAEVRASTGTEAEDWRTAIEDEFQKNFVDRNVFTTSTPEECRRYGAPLPMKLVYTIKASGKHKVRAVVCGHWEKTHPTQQLWTAQAEPASMIAALRLSLLRGWDVGAVAVSGAFMYAPIPDSQLVVVKPLGHLWTLASPSLTSVGLFIVPSMASASRQELGALREMALCGLTAGKPTASSTCSPSASPIRKFGGSIEQTILAICWDSSWSTSTTSWSVRPLVQ